MKFLILHGSYGTIDGNWFPQLKEKLELLGQKVVLEQLPIEDWEEVTKRGREYEPQKQNIDNWLKVFEKKIYPKIKDEKLVVVAHSSGPIFLLHILERFKLNVDAAIFVSPFLDLKREDKWWQIHLVNDSFYKTDFDFAKLRKQIGCSYVLYSENDPYVPVKRALEFAEKMGSSTIPVMGGQHLNAEVNLNEFPLVLELCKSRIKLTLYQKYLAHLSKHNPFEMVKQGVGKALYLPVSELTKEGVFHYNNLQKGGFCTLPVTAAEFWSEKQSRYMKVGRKAAKRVKITRVYLLEKEGDLRIKAVKMMMDLDKKAGIEVLYAYFRDIEKRVKELDFGIWDNEYVCLVRQKGKEVTMVLDSRKKALEKAREWKKIILAVAKKC